MPLKVADVRAEVAAGKLQIHWRCWGVSSPLCVE